MIDLRLTWNAAMGRADLVLNGPALDVSHVLETWVIVSLFSDRLADPSDRLLPNETDPRGWSGDDYSSVRGDRTGSKFWLRRKSYAGLPLVIENDALESLQWMKEDQIVTNITAKAWFAGLTQRQINVAVTLLRDGRPLNFQFDNAWREAAGGAG